MKPVELADVLAGETRESETMAVPALDEAIPRTETQRATPVPMSGGEPSEDFLRLIPHEYARRHLILSSGAEPAAQTASTSAGQLERLCIAERTPLTAVHNVSVRLKRPVATTIANAESLATSIDAAYAAFAERSAAAARAASTDTSAALSGPLAAPLTEISIATDLETELATAVRDAERDLLNVAGKAPSVRLVDLILFEAIQQSASDVHIQPIKDKTLVRYRLDGALHTTRELPGALASSVVSRIKVMANMDVAEKRSPQDGRAAVSIGGAGIRANASTRQIDLRVSTLPSTYGERVVLRLLDPSRSTKLTTFEALGMPESIRLPYLAQAGRTSGIVLSTGPTGSGKTTTLYATLAHISASNAAGSSGPLIGGRMPGCELNMMTIEDPVEYDLSASGLSISQTQVDSKKNVTFSTGLRHILRQDPDVIMVGEIRDEDTARIAVQASLTGHLVLSTLHTNDAPSAVVRLIDLSVEPFLVASSLAAVLAQRLVRTLHQPCRGEGCPGCMGSGFKGRTGVFELLTMDAELRELTVKRASAMDLKTAAVNPARGGAGMVTLRQAGLALVHAGLTTHAEVARVIETLEEDLA